MDAKLNAVLIVCICTVCCIEGQRRFDKISKSKTAEGGLGPRHSNANFALGVPRTKLTSISSCACRRFDQRVEITDTDTKTCQCVCKEGFVGSPPNCTIGPELWEVCFKGNPCGPNSDCNVNENGDHLCLCMSGFIGSPPNCRLGRKNRAKCKSCGPNSRCLTFLHHSICSCAAGFVGNPPNCTAGPTLLKFCDPYPCGPNSRCEKAGGVATCSCLPGYDGEPPNCKPGPEVWRICFKEKMCDFFSTCGVQEKGFVCSRCPEGFLGETPYCLLDDE